MHQEEKTFQFKDSVVLNQNKIKCSLWKTNIEQLNLREFPGMSLHCTSHLALYFPPYYGLRSKLESFKNASSGCKKMTYIQRFLGDSKYPCSLTPIDRYSLHSRWWVMRDNMNDTHPLNTAYCNFCSDARASLEIKKCKISQFCEN